MVDDQRLGATFAAIVPGDATAVIGRSLVALIAADPSQEVVELIWGVAEQEGDFDDALASLGQTGFADLPSMALFAWEGQGCRVMIRGQVGLEVCDTAGLQLADLQGGTVRSWAEHAYEGVGSVRAWVGDVRVATAEFAGYAIDRGIAPARGVDVLAPGSAVPRPPKKARPKAKGTSGTGREAALAAAARLAERGVVAPDLAPAASAEPDAPATAPEAPTAPLPEGEPEWAPSPSLDTILPGELEPPLADAPVAAPPVPPPPAPAEEPVSGFDHLFGATEFRSVEDAAVRPLEADEILRAPDPPAHVSRTVSSDHDGHTITAAELRALQAAEAAASAGPPAPSAPPAVPAGPGHLALRCRSGHLSPPHAAICRACGLPVGGSTPIRVSTLDLGVLRFRSGMRVPVHRSLLIGRSPRVNGAVGVDAPELVTVPSPGQDISRNHVEVRVEGWQVMVIDKGSTNGTTVILPGRDPQRLRPEHPFPLPVGARVDLAGEAEFTFEVGP